MIGLHFVRFFEDGEQAADHPLSSGTVIAEVPENAVKPGRVDLGVVDEQENEEAGDALVVEQLAAAEPDGVGRGQKRGRVRSETGSAASEGVSSPSIARNSEASDDKLKYKLAGEVKAE